MGGAWLVPGPLGLFEPPADRTSYTGCGSGADDGARISTVLEGASGRRADTPECSDRRADTSECSGRRADTPECANQHAILDVYPDPGEAGPGAYVARAEGRTGLHARLRGHDTHAGQS